MCGLQLYGPGGVVIQRSVYPPSILGRHLSTSAAPLSRSPPLSTLCLCILDMARSLGFKYRGPSAAPAVLQPAVATLERKWNKEMREWHNSEAESEC